MTIAVPLAPPLRVRRSDRPWYRDWLGDRRERATARPAARYRGELHQVQGFTMRLSAQEWIQRKLIEDGVHEWAETAILPTFVRRGWTAFDVGANIGYYSLILSRLVGPEGRVYAFEPNPLARERLEEHVAINGTSNVEVTSLALGERLGEGRFRFDPDAPTSHEVPNWGSWSLARSRRAGNVNVTFSTADLVVRACAIERVHFMKIDVEGLELSVLRGAREILHRHRPFCLVEFHAAAEPDMERLHKVQALLESRRYTICRVHKHPWPHLRELTADDLKPPLHFYVLAYPGRHDIHL